MTEVEPRAEAVGDRARRLHAEHYDDLVRLASMFLHDVAQAEDVVQDAFVTVLTGRRATDPDREAGYLRSIVLNGARDVLRRGTRRRRRDRELAAPQRMVDPADGLDAAVAGEEHRLVLDGVRRLPRRQAEVLVLRYWMDLSEAEIAETLGVSAGSVKTHASRGLRRLAEDLEALER